MKEPTKRVRGIWGFYPEMKILQKSITPFPLVSEVLPTAVIKTDEITEVEWILRDRETHIGEKIAKEMEVPLELTEVRGAHNLLARGQAGPMIVDNHELTSTAEYNTYWARHRKFPVVRHATVTLDFGEMLNGRLIFDVEGNDGAIIDVAWAPILIDGRVHPNAYFDNSNADRYFLREGRQTIESFNWRNFRYVRLTFRDLDRPLMLHRIRARKLDYPYEEVGRFDCSDPLITKIWNSSAKTMKLSTIDNFYSDMYREIAIYGADPADGVLCVFVCFGNPPVVTQYFDMLSRYKDDEGFYIGKMLDNLTQGYSYEQAQHVASRVADTLYWWNDPEQFNLLYPPLLEYIRANEKFLNPHLGVLENARIGRIGSFLDWGGGHAAPGAVSLHQNLLFFELLNKTAAVARAHDRTLDAEYLDALAKPIPDQMLRIMWDPVREIYVNNAYVGAPLLNPKKFPDRELAAITEHANYTALLFDLGRGGREDEVLRALDRNPSEVYQVEPMYTLIPMQALFHIGESKRALDFMRERLSRAFINGFDTLPEEWSPLASFRKRKRLIGRLRGVVYNSATVPAFVLSTEVLGVKPTAPGFSRFVVKPQPGDLTWAEGTVPTPKGNVDVRWEMSGGEFHLKVTVPWDGPGNIYLPDGKAFWVAGEKLTSDQANRLTLTEECRVFEVNKNGTYEFRVEL